MQLKGDVGVLLRALGTSHASHHTNYTHKLDKRQLGKWQRETERERGRER